MRVKKEINIQLGERIKILRERANLTQEQMAERIDVSPQYISDLERGVVGISVATLRRLCMALCISSDQILFGALVENRVEILANMCQSLSEEEFGILIEIVSKYVEAMNMHNNK